jgi:hypothetical protein
VRLVLFVTAALGAAYAGNLLNVGHVRTSMAALGIALVVWIVAMLIGPREVKR